MSIRVGSWFQSAGSPAELTTNKHQWTRICRELFLADSRRFVVPILCWPAAWTANLPRIIGVNSRLSCRTPRQRVQIGWHKRDAVFLGWLADTASVCIPIATVPDAPGSVARICPSKLAQFPGMVSLLETASAQMPGSGTRPLCGAMRRTA